MKTEIERLREENNRYREALEIIANAEPEELLFFQLVEMRKIARAALEK